MLSNIGMVLIILGWLIQLLTKEKNMKVSFVLIYSLGVAFLAFDGLRSGVTTLGILNLISCITAFAVLFKIKK